MKELYSNCCNALLAIIHGDEGTSYWECTNCQKPSDPVSKPPESVCKCSVGYGVPGLVFRDRGCPLHGVKSENVTVKNSVKEYATDYKVEEPEKPHQYGEHGAFGYVTPTGRICVE